MGDLEAARQEIAYWATRAIGAEAERDRYREALEEVRHLGEHRFGNGPLIASAALEGPVTPRLAEDGIREPLARFVAAYEGWVAECMTGKVDQERSRAVDEELEEALAAAKVALGEGAG